MTSYYNRQCATSNSVLLLIHKVFAEKFGLGIILEIDTWWGVEESSKPGLYKRYQLGPMSLK